MNLMKSADRLFPSNGSQVGGLRAFKFLQQCVGDIPFNIVYPSGTNALISDFSDSAPANELGKELPESESIEFQLPLKDINNRLVVIMSRFK